MMTSKDLGKLQIIAGIFLALSGGVFMIFDMFSLSVRIALGIIGFLLIGTSKRRFV